MLILTTVVSLEAIYLSIFIQLTINRQSRQIEEVSEDVEELSENVEDISEDVEEIGEGFRVSVFKQAHVSGVIFEGDIQTGGVVVSRLCGDISFPENVQYLPAPFDQGVFLRVDPDFTDKSGG